MDDLEDTEIYTLIVIADGHIEQVNLFSYSGDAVRSAEILFTKRLGYRVAIQIWEGLVNDSLGKLIYQGNNQSGGKMVRVGRG